MRERISTFASTQNSFSIQKKKLIVLDEADAMTNEAQHALQKIMDMYSYNTCFCIICNYISKIVPEILSRCTRFRFPPLPNKTVVQFIKYVAKNENIKIKKSAIDAIMNISLGDMRQVLNIIQSCSNITKNISEDDICTIMFKPTTTMIEDIVKNMFSLNMKERFLYMNDYIKTTGISISDLVKYIGTYLLDNSKLFLNNIEFNEIIEKFAKIEIKSYSDTSNQVKIIAFISCF